MTQNDHRNQVLVLQHSKGVDAGWLDDAFANAGLESILVRLEAGEELPQAVDWKGIVALGGIMGAYQEEDYPFFAIEKKFLARAVGDDVPILGICLGSQLLADALGGVAYKAPSPEAGFLSVMVTEAGREDPVFRHVPDRVVVSHGDTFDLPPGAVLLARTNRYLHAFRLGSALAVQFHPEAGPDLVEGWVEQSGGGGNIAAAGVDPEKLIEELRANERLMHDQALAFFGAWLAHL
jgi:GMP synthase-like glutamine amidotransferase